MELEKKEGKYTFYMIHTKGRFLKLTNPVPNPQTRGLWLVPIDPRSSFESLLSSTGSFMLTQSSATCLQGFNKNIKY